MGRRACAPQGGRAMEGWLDPLRQVTLWRSIVSGDRPPVGTGRGDTSLARSAGCSRRTTTRTWASRVRPAPGAAAGGQRDVRVTASNAGPPCRGDHACGARPTACGEDETTCARERPVGCTRKNGGAPVPALGRPVLGADVFYRGLMSAAGRARRHLAWGRTNFPLSRTGTRSRFDETSHPLFPPSGDARWQDDAPPSSPRALRG